MNTTKPNTLPAGTAPGFAKLKSQPGVFRCKLWPCTDKKLPEHADYRGVLQMSGGAKAQIYLWVHADGSLGLRLEMIKRRDHGGVHAENAGKTVVGCAITL
jgi:hypothetical protein